jgi:diguanylate cyclase (GGDEF)-like protein
MWMNPYYNQNNNVFMISYVVPLYSDDRFVGVVGMDFDYTVLTERVHEIKIYENGSAHLELNGETIHTDGSAVNGGLSSDDRYLSASRQLANGMTLVLSADYDDINKISYTIAFRILLSMLFLMLIFSLIVFFMIRQLVMPLKKLTEASIKLSKGDYDVDIEHSDAEEIKLLSTAFENMIMNLREHTKLQHMLAYRDPMTGLRNTTSYKEWILDFEKNISDECASFGVAVLDINNLKETNDTYGHILGNNLIVTVSRIISDKFKRSPVFRIGGDEFVVILQGRDLDEMDVLFSELEDEFNNSYLKSGSSVIPVSVARGFAEFAPGRDSEFADVFNRADDRMYRNKNEMKHIKN